MARFSTLPTFGSDSAAPVASAPVRTYRLFNPYDHLSESCVLTADETARVFGSLPAEARECVDRGGVWRFGPHECQRVWCVEARAAVRARLAV